MRTQKALRTEKVPKADLAQTILSSLEAGFGGGTLTMELIISSGSQIRKRSRFQLPSGNVISLSEHYGLMLASVGILDDNDLISRIQESSQQRIMALLPIEQARFSRKKDQILVRDFQRWELWDLVMVSGMGCLMPCFELSTLT